MIPRIKSVQPRENFVLDVVFENGARVLYDLHDDMNTLPDYDSLKKTEGLYRNVKLDDSRTCVYWNDRIDLPSDTIYEYGKRLA